MGFITACNKFLGLRIFQKELNSEVHNPSPISWVSSKCFLAIHFVIWWNNSIGRDHLSVPSIGFFPYETPCHKRLISWVSVDDHRLLGKTAVLIKWVNKNGQFLLPPHIAKLSAVFSVYCSLNTFIITVLTDALGYLCPVNRSGILCKHTAKDPLGSNALLFLAEHLFFANHRHGHFPCSILLWMTAIKTYSSQGK